jgi:hypothetical protein
VATGAAPVATPAWHTARRGRTQQYACLQRVSTLTHKRTHLQHALEDGLHPVQPRKLPSRRLIAPGQPRYGLQVSHRLFCASIEAQKEGRRQEEGRRGDSEGGTKYNAGSASSAAQAGTASRQTARSCRYCRRPLLGGGTTAHIPHTALTLVVLGALLQQLQAVRQLPALQAGGVQGQE